MVDYFIKHTDIRIYFNQRYIFLESSEYQNKLYNKLMLLAFIVVGIWKMSISKIPNICKRWAIYFSKIPIFANMNEFFSRKISFSSFQTKIQYCKIWAIYFSKIPTFNVFFLQLVSSRISFASWTRAKKVEPTNEIFQHFSFVGLWEREKNLVCELTAS